MSTPNKSEIPIKHHFVPKFYLENFSIPNSEPLNLWVQQVGKPPRLSTPKKEGYERNLHTILTKDGTEDRSLEFALVEKEGIAASIIKKIIKDKGGQNMSQSERLNFAFFIGLMLVRTPQFFTEIKRMTAIYNDALTKALNGDTEQLAKLAAAAKMGTAEEFLKNRSKEAIKDWLKQDKMHTYMHLISMESLANTHAKKIYEDMGWYYLLAPEGYEYCTCDDPVIRWSPNDTEGWRHGIGHEETQIFFPISPQICFFAKRGRITQSDSVQFINELIVWQAQRFVYSSSENPEINIYLKQREDLEKVQPRKVVIDSRFKPLES
ncbi:MAG: hypothetical protein JWM56_108 [Candidatus Peribacteria bacterium]|nr:hypothetical protein [Candidatus Peribacteria bacterium]